MQVIVFSLGMLQIDLQQRTSKISQGTGLHIGTFSAGLLLSKCSSRLHYQYSRRTEFNH